LPRPSARDVPAGLFVPACASSLGPPCRLQRLAGDSADARVSADIHLHEVSSLPELPPARLTDF
jgi:hypothetical protein